MSRAAIWGSAALCAWVVVGLLWAGGLLPLATIIAALFVLAASIGDLASDPIDWSAVDWAAGSAVVIAVVGLLWL